MNRSDVLSVESLCDDPPNTSSFTLTPGGAGDVHCDAISMFPDHVIFKASITCDLQPDGNYTWSEECQRKSSRSRGRHILSSV